MTTTTSFGWLHGAKDAKTDVSLVREARKGLGPDLDLMIDAGLVFDAKTAIQRARAFEEFNPFWFEEPLLPDDYEGYAKLFPDSKPAERLTWSKYRETIFDYLASRQGADGSWSQGHIGPVFTTACHLTILQLDNGTLPIYQR